MPIADTNKYMAEVFGYSQKFIDRLNGNVERAVARRLKQSLKNVQQQLANMYASMGDQVTFSEMNKYNRLAQIEASIADELKQMGIETTRTINGGIDDSFKETYYNGGYAFENGMGTKLGFTEIPTDAVKAALINPYDKIGWKTRSLEHFAALTVKIRGAVTEGLVQGYGYNKTAKIFAEKFANTTNSLIKIVQTETHRATELANLTSTDKAKAAAERLGLILKREWRATLDGKTRDQHARLDGQIEDDEGYFQIDGMRGIAPGNFGIASMDISCRCSTVTQLDGETPAKRWDNVEKKRIPYQTYEEWAKTKNIPMKYKKGGMPKAPKVEAPPIPKKEFDKYSHNYITKNSYEFVEDNKWIESLSREENISITHYCQDDYTAINNYLRGKSEALTELEREEIKNIKNALGRSALNRDAVLFRAVDLDNMADINLSVGLTYKDNGFCSTTIDIGMAKDFIKSTNIKKPAILQIYAPKGTKGAAVKFAAKHSDEYEVLITNDTEFEIFEHRMIEITKGNGRKGNADVFSVRIK